MPYKSNNYAVILAGGVGSRFWPLSRELEPKQFLNFNGQKSLLQQAIKRILPLVSPEKIYIISNQQYKFHIQKQISEFSIPETNVILEPQGKNTAPAIGLAARYISLIDNKATMIILPSDHYIANTKKLLGTLKNAVKIANKEYLVTIGITPNIAHTGYGYIKIGERKRNAQANCYPVERFVEKPDKKRAERYFREKCYFWNSGMFVWKAKTILKQIREYLPELDKMLEIMDVSNGVDSKIWNKIDPVSIDYGVLEKSEDVLVIPSEGLGWSDLGSWSALSEVLPKNKNGNVIQADSIDINSKNITVFGNSRLIASIGLNNLIISDTQDALLICEKSRAEEVKDIVRILNQKGRCESLVHKIAKRPWGSYAVLNEGNGFKTKIVEVLPHKRLSLQKHKFRSEHWVVVQGSAKITNGEKIYHLRENESAYIPKQGIHRLENPSDKPLKIIEVQCGHYLEEDDIERFEDDYNRKN